MALAGWQRSIACAWLFATSAARAEPSSGADDIYELSAQSETDVQLFRRALLPGPGGAIVETETQAPIYEHVQLSGRRIDTALGADTMDIEVSGWGLAHAAEPDARGRYDADLQTANVLLRVPQAPGLSLRLGRQQVAGGAARFARFDGAQTELHHRSGFVLGAYAGFVVLPRWDQRPGYYYLGALADSALKEPLADDSLNRGDFWLAGGKIGFEDTRWRASASLHEQRESAAIGRRGLGLDASGELTPDTALGGALLVELDSARLANLRLWGDLQATRKLLLSAEYLRVEPALLLSRQSVLSVFATDAYHETGASLNWRPLPHLKVQSGGWLEIYQDGGPGARFEAGFSVKSQGAFRSLLSINYVRVLTPDNGYHSTRSALRQQLLGALTATLQHYAYYYDEPIQGYRTSSVYATTVEYALLEDLALLWGGSLSQSPYASLDASTQLRLTYRLGTATRGSEW